MSALVSVIMPAFNADQFIGAAIQSVLMQTHANWELIIVDDGSTDNTKSVAEEFSKLDGRIKVLHQSNRKQGAARNHAIKHAHGEWLAFLDADDYWVPEKLSSQLYAANETKAKWLFSNAELLQQDTGEKCEIGAHIGWLNGLDAVEKVIHRNCIPLSTVLVSRQILIEAGGFTEMPAIQNAEDYHLWCRLLMKDVYAYGMPASLCIYRMHATAATAVDRTVALPLLHARADLAGIRHPLQHVVQSISFTEICSWLSINYNRSSEASQSVFAKFVLISKQCEISLSLPLRWPWYLLLPGRVIRRQFYAFHATD